MDRSRAVGNSRVEPGETVQTEVCLSTHDFNPVYGVNVEVVVVNYARYVF